MPEDLLWESAELLSSQEDEAPEIIPGLLSVEDKIILVAAPKVGKSILVQQIASSVAGGHEFLPGMMPVKGEHRVLYIAGEGDVFTWRKRGRNMGTRLPIAEERLWYWIMPSFMINTREGLQAMLEQAAIIHPTLTIIDPIYALMRGSMRDDEAAGDFVRNLNTYQHKTQSAVIVCHHSHRAIRTETGMTVSEGDKSYFGSMVFAAWPKSLWLMKKESNDLHYVHLSCRTNRDGRNAVESVHLMLAEPSPLLFTVADKLHKIGPSASVIYESLKTQPRTADDLITETERARSTVSTALNSLRTSGLVKPRGTRPEIWEVTEPWYTPQIVDVST